MDVIPCMLRSRISHIMRDLNICRALARRALAYAMRVVSALVVLFYPPNDPQTL